MIISLFMYAFKIVFIALSLSLQKSNFGHSARIVYLGKTAIPISGFEYTVEPG